jgi:hypothetical protein
MFPKVQLAALLAPLALAAACDTSVMAGDDDDVSVDAAGDTDATPSCAEARDHNDIEWLQVNVFSRSCASATSCHRGAALQAAGLNLEPGNSETNLVNRVAISEGIDGMGLTVVVPGDSDGSYLMVLIDHESKGGRLSGPLPEAGTMPAVNPLICVDKRDAVGRWIDSL